MRIWTFSLFVGKSHAETIQRSSVKLFIQFKGNEFLPYNAYENVYAHW
jgi:hypothetical protein